MPGLASTRSLPHPWGAIGAALGSAVLFVLALTVGLILHVNLPAARRFATHELNSALATEFKGKLTLERLATLHIDGASGIDVTVSAPDGTTVVVARGLSARIRPIALVKSLLRGSGDLDIDVFAIDVQFLDVDLDADEAGALKLATTFELLKPSTTPGGGRVLHLGLYDITVRHALVHGHMKGVPPIDAELDGLRGTLRVDGHRVAVDVSHVALLSRGMPQGANPRGAVEAHVLVPSKTGRSLGLDGSFDGTVGDIPATAKAAFDGNRLDAVLDVPEVSDERVRALVAQAPVYRPISAHVEAHGDLARLHATAEVAMAPSELRAEGDLVLEGTFGATIGIDLRNVDLQGLSPPAPHSTLALHADVQLDAKSGGMLAGRFTANVAGGDIGGEIVPGGAFRGDFEQKEPSSNAGSGGVEVKIEGTVSEPGAPIQVRADVRTDVPAPRVDFDVSTHVVRLSDVRRWSGLGPGGGELGVHGAIVLGATPSFDAALAGSVEGLAHGTAHMEKGQLAAHAFGSFTNPEVDATLDADGVRIARYKFHHAHVTTAGRIHSERVTIVLEGEGSPNLRASATIGISGAPTFEDVDADLSRGSRALHASATRVKVDATGVAVTGASITGIGEPVHASVDTRRGSLVLQGTSKGVDLGALGYLLGFEDKLRSGRLAFAVDLAARRDGADGSATVDLDHGSFAGLDDVSGHIETRMQGRKVTGTVKTSVGDVGTLDVSRMKLDVGGKGPLEADSWRRTWGVLQIDGQLDLAKAAALLPPNTLPVSKLAGRLTLQGALRRDDESDVTPDVALTLKTSGLRFAPRGGPDEMRNGTIVVVAPPWESSGIDVQLDVRADGDSGFAEIAARLVDKEGIIVSLDAKSAGVPYERLFASDVAAELLKDIPVSAVIVVPPRKLDHLPDLLKPAGASGDAEARVAIEGTFHKPSIDATAKTHSVKFDRSPLTGGLNADLTAKYDGAAADLAIDARSSRNGIVHATARVNAKVDDMLSKKAGPMPWDASAKATFERFPLGSIAGMSDRDVRGQMSGRIELTDWHKDARAILDLDLANLRVGAQTFQTGKVKVTLDGHSFDASARLERADAVASATANVGTIWGGNLAPSVDPAGSSDAAFQARHFPAAILTPFAEGILDELEGTIDADAHVALRPNEKATMQGSVVLRNGTVELTAVGEELHGVNAKVVFSPDGVVRLESLTAFGTSGKLTASGEARMDGLHLVGAEAVLNIPKGDAMPLALQGASLGSVYGQLALKAIASPDHKALNVKIDAESLHIELPEASSHSVEDLDAAEPGTHVGIYASPDRFVLLPLDEFDAEQALEVPTKSSNTLTVDVHLGQNVEIQRGTDLKVDLDGDLTAKTGDPTEVTGQIRLKGGKLDVQGKSFEIERGTMTFLGDSANPELNVTASWTAGDGTRVYADYVGPLKTGKVILRSEPARPQNEILALILFGSADGLQPAPSSGGSQTDSAAKAGTAVGGFATAGLTKGLNKLTGMEITAKVDTSGANAKPEVAVQIARDISLQIAVVVGNIAPGTNPDTTYATIDWRFFKDWSLETTFGSAGTSIADVVWQHRY